MRIQSVSGKPKAKEGKNIKKVNEIMMGEIKKESDRCKLYQLKTEINHPGEKNVVLSDLG